MCPFLRWRIKEEKKELTKSDIEKQTMAMDLVRFLFSSLILHLRKGHTVVSKRHGKKVKPNRRFKKNFLFLSCLNCLLSWDKNLINHDFHRRRLREVKIHFFVCAG